MLPELQLGPDDRVLMVSDQHLGPEHPELTPLFLTWLQGQLEAHRPSWLLVLGDLFDAWVGDDLLGQDEPNVAATVAFLRRTRSQGISLGLVPGNRDFLLGEGFARASGVNLFAEGLCLLQGERRARIEHGDRLCTDDHGYQAFRAQVRQPAWQAGFLAKPMAERLAIAQQLRSMSEQSKGEKDMAIMDVNPEACALALQEAQAPILIHGHTHRPGHYPLSTSGGLTAERWVLPDWRLAQGQLTHGGGLLWTPGEIRLLGLACSVRSKLAG